MEQELRDHPSVDDAFRPAKERAGNRGILFIAVFDLVKAVLFLVAAMGVFHLVGRNTHVELTRLLHGFRLNGDHALVKDLLLNSQRHYQPGQTHPDRSVAALHGDVRRRRNGFAVAQAVGRDISPWQ